MNKRDVNIIIAGIILFVIIIINSNFILGIDDEKQLILDSEKKIDVLTSLNKKLVEENEKLENLKRNYNEPFKGLNIINPLSYIKRTTLARDIQSQENLINDLNEKLELAKMDYEIPEVSSYAGPDIITYAGVSTKFFGQASSPKNRVVKYKWDFDGDGVFDYESDTPIAEHVYLRTGTYNVIFKAIDESGFSDEDFIKATVMVKGQKDIAEQDYLYSNVINNNIMLSKPADGVEKYYVVMINGGSESRFWNDVVQMYSTLKEVYNFTDEEIYLLNTDGKNPDHENPDNMIDYPANKDTVKVVFTELSNKIDKDDTLFVWVTDHGHGYYGPNSRSGGYYYGYLGSDATIDPGDSQDYLESDFKLRSFFGTNGNLGMNNWAIIYSYMSNIKELYYREKYVSHYSNIQLENNSFTSDQDIFLEAFVDYLSGDFNKNGFIEKDLGEIADFNKNNIPPYNFNTKEYDEGDWGKIDTIRDNLNSINSIVPYARQGRKYCIFDYNLDNKVDIDMNCTCSYSQVNQGSCNPSLLDVDGTDLDNLGLFDGIDINDDGDMNDWVSIDQMFQAYGDQIPDDDLKNYLNAINAKNIIVFMEPCFRGGFVDYLSKNNTVVMTATVEDDVSWGNIFVGYFTEAMKNVSLADKNNDKKVSMVEAFNYASQRDYAEKPQYDDNGDYLSNIYPIPNGKEGYLGMNLFLLKSNNSDQPPKSKLLNSESFSITGTLTLTLQTNLSGTWQDIQTVANKQITIPAQGSYDFKNDWNSVIVKPASAGNYRVYARFESAGQVKEASYEFKVQ